MINKELIKWKCNKCDTIYKCLPDGGLVYLQWRQLHVRNRSYFVKLYDGVSGNAPEFIVLGTVMDSFKDISEVEVIRWKFIPDWTPDNAEAHLGKVLAFL